MQETPSDPTVQSSAGLPDAIDPRTKPEDAAAVGQVFNGPAGDPEDANTDSTTSTSQASTEVVANPSGTPTISSPDASQAHGSGEDPTGGPSDPGNPSPPQPLIVGDQKITVPNPGATALKVGSQILDAQTPVLTISNTPISLASDKLQIGISVHPFTKPTPSAAGTVFTVGSQSLTLNPQGVTVNGIQIKVGGPPVTVDGTQFSLGPSEFIVGSKIETFAPATRGPGVEVDGVKEGAVGQGIAAGSERNVTTSVGADADVGGALMSGLGAVGGGATTHGAGQGSSGNVNSVAPFLGTASKTRGDEVGLWLRVGSGLFVSVYLVIGTN